jgi:transposase
VDSASGTASRVLAGYGRSVRSLGPGLTSDSADAVRAVLRDDLSAGPQVSWHPPALPVWSAQPGQEAGVHRSDGQRVRAIPQPEKGMTVTIVEEARPVTCRTAITGGVDTHADTHVAAALDPVGGLLGVREFPAAAAGYARLLSWLAGFGTVCLVGIEGTGSYGAGLARYIAAAGVRVVEVDRSDRQDRRRQGKSDPLDAVSAARAAQSGRASGAPKGRDGAVEAIRTLMVARRSAAGERTRTVNQARALILTGPDDLRARFAKHKPAALVTGLAALRPRPGDVAGHATRIALRELGRRAQFLDSQLVRLDELIIPLVTARAPGLLAIYGAGPRTAALLLIAAGDHPERLRSEAAWAHLCGVSPIPASSGKVTRHRPNPGGDRQANHALWRIVFTRLGSDAATRAYAERRTAEGKSKAEIIRCLKRYVAREVYRQLRPVAG